ncbi:MAG: AIR synthase-related protein, partial [Acidobacteriota bacterium]|nr:AIR synthase-related protein [Acidobacteriota bacterium]
TVGDELLNVHRSYLRPIQALIRANSLHAAAHVTGGGITNNTPRLLPKGLAASIDISSWTVPPIFEILRKIGNIPLDDYRRTFNLGVGMILVVPESRVAGARRVLKRLGETSFAMGNVVPQKRGRPRVEYR